MNDRRAQIIMTIPGIGYITAVTILAEIVDHKRFADAEKLTSYVGLVPKHHNSGPLAPACLPKYNIGSRRSPPARGNAIPRIRGNS